MLAKDSKMPAKKERSNHIYYNAVQWQGAPDSTDNMRKPEKLECRQGFIDSSIRIHQ